MNNKAQFTPGPWVVTQSGYGDAKVSADCGWIHKNGEPFKPTIVDRIDFPTGHLIAAAPAMYEALLQVREMLFILADNAGDVPEWNTGGEMYELAHIVRTALAQAEGRQA